MAEEKIVVVGGVAAGMSAASQAKRRNPRSRVLVFEKGEFISYGACGMPYNIGDPTRAMEDLLVLSPKVAREKRGIELLTGHEAVALDIESKSLQIRNLEDARVFQESYDKLILATGARPTVLDLPGFDLPGVSVLRNFNEGKRVKAAVAHSKPGKAVIVGAGYIAMEMAHVLSELGFEVTILKRKRSIIPGWHPETIARVEAELTAHGVQVHSHISLERAEAGENGRVARVITQQGVFEADLVLVAAGVHPNVGLAVSGGLRIGETGAIWVDQQQQTSVPGVWAAGDCAEAYHRVLRRNQWIPLGTTANKQGRIAGANAVGAGLRFHGIVGTTGFKVFDLEVVRSGISVEPAKAEGFEPVSVTIQQSSRAHGYPGGNPVQVSLIADAPTGILLGGELVGRNSAAMRINIIATALASHLSVEDLQNLDLVYSPPLAPVWDPVLVAANQLIKKVGRKN